MESRWVLLCVLLCVVAGYDRPHGLYLVCPPEAGSRCQQTSFTKNEHFYTINGFLQVFDFMEGFKFKMSCSKVSLDDPALPRFPRLVHFNVVILQRCALPEAIASYWTALRRLNVSVHDKVVLDKLPDGARLTRAALADLPATVTELELEGAVGQTLIVEPGALVGLAQLLRLRLTRVRPDRLPPHLTRLLLKSSGSTRLPGPLDNLEMLDVEENALEDASALAALEALQELRLSAPLPALPPLPAALVNLTLARVGLRSAPPLQRCDRLRRLTLEGSAAQLPPGWLAACPHLEVLKLHLQTNRSRLPPGLLRGAANLRELHLMWSRYDTLPADLFEYSPNVRVVNLSHNELETLPSALFGGVAGKLEQLDLSANRLSALGVCAALRPLSALTALRLARNPLGDLCAALPNRLSTNAVSCLSEASELQFLSLAFTGATRLCSDWLRDLPALRRLDLTHNNISAVSLSDLNSMKRSQPSQLDLTSNPLRSLVADEAAYRAAAGELPPAQTTVVLDSELRCDCASFWFARALREGRVAAKLEPRCAGGVPLRKVELRQLVCPVEASVCAPCSCEAAPLEGGLRMQCGAQQRPPLSLLSGQGEPRVRHLRLRSAKLKAMPLPLPPDLLFLDLDNNSISRASAEEGAQVFDSARQVRLTNNPLACDCARDSLLPLLRARRHQLIELNETRCADDRRLVEMLEVECGGEGIRGAGALAALAVAAAATAAGAALMARAEPRLRLKAWLYARGVRGRWLRRGGGGADAARLFDAFISHAPFDAHFVAKHLAPVLQKHGYKLCLKERDWPPGAWIPSQIEASVAASRRTIAVVSPPRQSEGSRPTEGPRQSEGSRPSEDPRPEAWADAELRAAHAASLREKTPRLIIVLLGPLPPDLKEMARSHICLRWGERCFWEKLLYALPDPTKRPTVAGKTPA